MVKPAVAMVHFESRYVVCPCQQLMAEAYTKERLFSSEYILNSAYRIIHRSRIAGPVRYKVAMRLECLQFFNTCLCREYFYISATVGKALQYLYFYPIIHYRDANRCLGI